MKKIFLSASLLALTLFSKAQRTDSLFQKKAVSKTDIQIVYSQYIQNGNNSAVTGGIGTELLHVYAPGAKISRTFKGYHQLNVDFGVDIISSASTDNIDFVVSSASALDQRVHINANYKKQLKRSPVKLGIGSGFSIESDYLSIPVMLSWEYAEPSQNRSYQAFFQAFFDDLRWGRLNPDYYRPVTLIYPVELRYKDWYEGYTRNSYNLKLGFTQVINRRLIAGFFPEFTYQKGLLATPFHRVYFKDGSEKVEFFPGERYKIPVSFQLNYFLGSRMVLKGNYGFYWDNFGILANSLELEDAIKITPQFTLSPFLRVYQQSASKYFKPYQEHEIHEQFYTSDYDLSKFQSYKTGVNFRLLPARKNKHRLIFEEINLRYSYYHRSNNLNSHILSLVLDFSSPDK